jgi:hypothetical protein
MTKFLLLSARPLPPRPDLADSGELLDAQTLSSPDLAVILHTRSQQPTRLHTYWLIDVDSLTRAMEIATEASPDTPIEIRQLMTTTAVTDL